MSENPETPIGIPEWDISDRLRKAMRASGVGVQDMADYLGVARNTVSTWINGKHAASPQTLRLWSMRCNVPLEWLETGARPTPGGGPDGGTKLSVIGGKTRHDRTDVAVYSLARAA